MTSYLTSAFPPQQYDMLTTPKIMWGTALAVLPSVGWGIYQYGTPAFALVGTTLFVAILAELLFSMLLNRGSLADGNGVMIGLLLAAAFPPGTPIYAAGAATLFSMAVIKWTFGGTGSYWVNPIAGGYVFAVVSFPSFGGSWMLPRLLGGPSEGYQAPLQLLTGASVESSTRLGEAYYRLAPHGTTPLDEQVTRLINNVGGEFLGVRIPAGYADLFLGNVPSSIGGASVALLLLGSVFLLGRTIISSVIPFFFLTSFSLLIYLLGGLPYGAPLFTGDILFHLTTGGAILGALFVATETVSAPLTTPGMVVYGILAGVLAALLRLFGDGVHAVMLAILLANMVVPLVDRYTMPRLYGSGRGAG
ncbi:MAG: RnfABCDGE type electron transport complex subunit D [Alkalispirochaetaceae bacterium]